MRAAFTTVFRAGGINYLNDSLESMFARDPTSKQLDLKIFSDSVEPPKIPSSIKLEIECRTPEDLAAVQAEQLINARNQIRLLRWVGAVEDPNELCFTFEDDIEFCFDWLVKARKLAAMIKDPEFVLLLHHFRYAMVEEEFQPVGMLRGNPVRGLWLAEKWTMLWGAQAVVMTAGVALKMADAMEKGISEGQTLGAKLAWGIADQGINHYCQTFTGHELDHEYVGLGLCNLYCVFPCMVAHVGVVSGWDTGFTGGGAAPTKYFLP